MVNSEDCYFLIGFPVLDRFDPFSFEDGHRLETVGVLILPYLVNVLWVKLYWNKLSDYLVGSVFNIGARSHVR